NPFTFTVHPTTGVIFVNDVGSNRFEEVNQLAAGGNYGWPTEEGAGPNPAFIDPIHQYARGAGAATIGGLFYTATQFPAEFRGDFFFGDSAQGFIRRLDATDTSTALPFATGVQGLVDLDLGADGAIYYLNIGSGGVFRIQSTAVDPDPDPGPGPGPAPADPAPLPSPTVTAVDAVGREDQSIPLSIQAVGSMGTGVETFVFLSGVPADATLSAGIRQSDGRWLLTPAQLTGLTFRPAADAFGRFTLTATARSTRAADDAVTTAAATFTVTATAVNDPPILTSNRVQFVRTSVATRRAGFVAATLVRGRAVDVDSTGLGVAVVQARAPRGARWQFSTTNGRSWRNMGRVGEQRVRLLRAGDRIRLIGAGGRASTARLRVRVWDQSLGRFGSMTARAALRNAETSAVSAASVVARVSNRTTAPRTIVPANLDRLSAELVDAALREFGD
ncbi:MAG: PQQ-dependent sugar dehydrogenase, partial [Planctomycetia bacterium]